MKDVQKNPAIDDLIKISTIDRDGLTLLELLMVLVILAIVSTVALSSLQPQIDQQRYESSRNLLKQVESSVIGPIGKYQIDKTPLISGFVADVGRLPSTIAFQANSENQTDPLEELWSNQSVLATSFPFQVRSGPNQPVDCSDIQLPCGWRGPYIQLPIGDVGVKDPWGRFLQADLGTTGDVLGLGLTIPGTSSDTEEEGSLGPAEFDQAAAESSGRLSLQLDSGLVTVTGRVVTDGEASGLKVYLVLPDPSRSVTELSVREDEDQIPESFTFSNVPIGLRAIVVQNQGERFKKYIQVTHQGTDVTFDLNTP